MGVLEGSLYKVVQERGDCDRLGGSGAILLALETLALCISIFQACAI